MPDSDALGRSLLSAATGESKSAFRASCPLASACPLCLASGAGQGTARSADRAGSELSAQPQAFAHRRHPTRGVSGISGESLTEQHAVSLCAAPRKGSLLPSIPSAEPLPSLRRSIELACRACFPASPITRNSTAESRRTSAPASHFEGLLRMLSPLAHALVAGAELADSPRDRAALLWQGQVDSSTGCPSSPLHPGCLSVFTKPSR